MNYEALMKLSNFINARVEELENREGEKEMCLVIPMEINGLYKTRNGNVFCKMFVNERVSFTSDGNTHSFRAMINPTLNAKLVSLGYESPYLGTMKPSRFKTKFQENNDRLRNQFVKNDID